MADSVALAVYGVLNQGAIPRRASDVAADSTPRVDACSLLREQDLAPLLGRDAPPELFTDTPTRALR
jgi:hypothetical protein